MRVGGFVIHGNSERTLGRCLKDLLSVCDEVVAVDSGASDESPAIVRDCGVRAVHHSWQGYGGARAAAALALAHCDYLFFLDSDEWLVEGALSAFERWRQSNSNLPHYTVVRRDWADIDGRRFVFRKETRTRLVRRDCAVWAPEWIVHEALPKRPSAPLDFFVEHAFATSIQGLAAKQTEYAFLWAVRARAEGKQARQLPLRRLTSALRNGVVKGALWRGGLSGWRLAWAAANYHARKHEILAQLERGELSEAMQAYGEGNYAEVFKLAKSFQ